MLSPNPYKIDGPALISFSGGRTSGYMLHEIIAAHGGTLPADVIVTFANTGKERPETLDFVRDIQVNWNVPVIWLERVSGERGPLFAQVSHNSASRDGEPFAALLNDKQYLPNPVTRFCSIELKIRVISSYCRSLGWEHWTNVVGFRADEKGRVAKAFARNENGKERWKTVCPLDTAGVMQADVLAFWARQPFDLHLKSYEGNCDLCFLKSSGKRVTIMRERPDLAEWWIKAEAEARSSKPSGATFRIDGPNYATLADFAERQGWMFDDIFDDHQSCDTTCTD